MRDLAVSDINSVQPHVKAGVNSLKIQIGAGSFGIPVPRKALKITAAGIILRHEGRVKWERVSDICILIFVIPSHLPAERDVLSLPFVIRHILLSVELLPQVVNAGIIAEEPFASAEHLHTVGILSGRKSAYILCGIRSWNKVTVIRYSILMQNRQIFIESWYNQVRNTPFFSNAFKAANARIRNDNYIKNDTIHTFKSI